MKSKPGQFYKLSVELAARRDISAPAKLVLAVVTDRIGDNGHAWPGTRSLAQDTGLSRPTVIKAISDAESKGLLIVDRGESGKVNHYRLPNKSGQESLPVLEDEQSESGKESLPVADSQKNKSGQESLLVKPIDRSNPLTTTGQALLPEPVKAFDHNQTDLLNQPNNISRPNGEALRLASFLFESIRERKPDFREPNLQMWAKHIDYMIRLDHRQPERIEAVITWAQHDAGNGGNWRGWQDNILCTEKLRKHFDKLELQMEAKSNDRTQKRSRDFDRQESTIGTIVTV